MTDSTHIDLGDPGDEAARAVLADFYRRTGLTPTWLRQQSNARAWPPAKARIGRVQSMAKMTGHHLSKRGDEWLLTLRGQPMSHAECKAAFARCEGQCFGDIETELFRLLEASSEIPGWLVRHHSTWTALRAFEEVGRRLDRPSEGRATDDS